MSEQNTPTPQSPANPIVQAVQSLSAVPAAQRKAACKAALRQRLNTPSQLLRVENTGDLELYVKTFSVAEADEMRRTAQALRQEFADSPVPHYLRDAALEIFDADGKPYFDPRNDDDMRLLAALPSVVFADCQTASFRANGGDALKNLLAAESGS